jgi:hypothetical protein
MDNEADEHLTRWVVRQTDVELDRQLDIWTVRLMDYHTGGQTEE